MKSLALPLVLALSLGAHSCAPLESTGTLAAVNKGERTLTLIDLATGKTTASFPTGPNPQEVAISPDGTTAVVTNMGQGRAEPGRTLTVVDLVGRKVRKEVELGEHAAPHGVVFLDGKRVLLTSHATNSVVTVDLEKGAVERAISTEGDGTHLVVLSPDQKRAYTANVLTGDVSVIDLDAGKVVKRVPAGRRAEGISISPDGKVVAIGNVAEHTVTLIDTEKLNPTKTLENVRGPIRTFFTRDGKHLLVSCAETGEIAVFRTSDFTEQKRLALAGRSDLTLRGGRVPMPMNFARHPVEARLYTVVFNADATLVVDEARLEVVGVLATGKVPDGIAVGRV